MLILSKISTIFTKQNFSLYMIFICAISTWIWHDHINTMSYPEVLHWDNNKTDFRENKQIVETKQKIKNSNLTLKKKWIF